MLFIPIDVYLWNRSFILTSGLNHVAWFHFTLFSFQRTISVAHFSDSFIVSHRFVSVKNFFKFFFEAFWWKQPQPLASQGLVSFLFPPYLSATCIMIHAFLYIVNTIFKKSINFIFYKNKKAHHTNGTLTITNGGGEEIWTPDTAGMNRML